jgi:hypothetical protein
MTATTTVNELATEATLPVTTASATLARMSFPTRREMIEAARILDPADPLGTIVTQHATVVATAQTRSVTNVR